MIQLTRLNNQPLMVNSDLIKFVEKAPDTVLTLLNGEKIIVLESTQAVLDKIVAFRQSILTGFLAPDPDFSRSTATGSAPPAPADPQET